MRKPDRVQKRNQSLADILCEAREQKHIPVTFCADALGTSRRRYLALESGESFISLAELEVLMELLDIPERAVWPERQDGTPVLLTQIAPGELVMTVKIQLATAPST